MRAWLRAGLDYDAFWRRTPREISVILSERHSGDMDRQDAARAVNHELARLVAFAFHEPKEMPDFEPVHKDKSAAKGPSEPTPLDDARVRGFFHNLANKGA